ncbi:methylase involved in ubiquinone/menaquinone biosynthesis [Desulfitobacterium dehalogenans ATCC 51507]|uniref:Methylase involved in ubiquinone/menaquinone biosynthesis n=1 Tax=Desulfitobacterium dehalogenans (strain ATCC 51507 / DSM 9161 / JW/IU-DC1) TaxID=756499 RepID=I4A5R7_DESDJ|nr:class I SAM-dependent methyltransferase [Desulfitobacterium dehalogenans]AFL99301.1 methylase involved in ubiquinone/menaquinone biosynthesis [Desulfitobacterium dehalogenans ATCC 51507]
MRKTDYRNIADKYDKNKYRQEIKPDEDLKRYVDKWTSQGINVLDLACGTGIYLQNQINIFQNASIDWHGLDASEEMLHIAKSKTDRCSFTNGLAEALPYESDSFDFIINNYAFHHFCQKADVLDEVFRVIKKNGVLKIHNISIHDMRHWWIYEFFPSTYYEDLKRFWSKELIFNELLSRGFDVNVRMEFVMKSNKITEFMDHVYNRDISALTLISDAEYHHGLEMMEYRIKNDPEALVINDFADIVFIATKR